LSELPEIAVGILLSTPIVLSPVVLLYLLIRRFPHADEPIRLVSLPAISLFFLFPPVLSIHIVYTSWKDRLGAGGATLAALLLAFADFMVSIVLADLSIVGGVLFQFAGLLHWWFLPVTLVALRIARPRRHAGRGASDSL
jgi:hypothetical protein